MIHPSGTNPVHQKPTPAMNAKNSALLFLAGMASGAALGVLFAPDSGTETRRKLRGKGAEARRRLESVIAEGREEWSRMKGKASDAASMTRDEVDDLIHYLFREGRRFWDRVTEEGEDAAASPHNGRRQRQGTHGTTS
jgi:gas vesicle protein